MNCKCKAIPKSEQDRPNDYGGRCCPAASAETIAEGEQAVASLPQVAIQEPVDESIPNVPQVVRERCGSGTWCRENCHQCKRKYGNIYCCYRTVGEVEVNYTHSLDNYTKSLVEPVVENSSLQKLPNIENVPGYCRGFDTGSYAYCDEPEGSMWCWAAAATEIATHFVYPRVWCSSMCQVVGRRIGQNCCGSAPSRACWNQGGYGSDVANAINWLTGGQVQYSYFSNHIYENYLQYYLQFGPVAVLVSWYCDARKSSYCGGHFITVMGCFQRNSMVSYYVHDVGNNRGNYHVVGNYNQLLTYVPPSNRQISGRWTGTLYKTSALGDASAAILNETVIVV